MTVPNRVRTRLIGKVERTRTTQNTQGNTRERRTRIPPPRNSQITCNGWEGVTVLTNSSHVLGMSFLHGHVSVFVDPAISRKNLKLELQLIGVANGKVPHGRERINIGFSVEGSNPRMVTSATTYNFWINNINKATYEGLQTYARHIFHFSAKLTRNNSRVETIENNTMFYIRSTPITPTRPNKKRKNVSSPTFISDSDSPSSPGPVARRKKAKAQRPKKVQKVENEESVEIETEGEEEEEAKREEKEEEKKEQKEEEEWRKVLEVVEKETEQMQLQKDQKEAKETETEMKIEIESESEKEKEKEKESDKENEKEGNKTESGKKAIEEIWESVDSNMEVGSDFLSFYTDFLHNGQKTNDQLVTCDPIFGDLDTSCLPSVTLFLPSFSPFSSSSPSSTSFPSSFSL